MRGVYQILSNEVYKEIYDFFPTAKTEKIESDTNDGEASRESQKSMKIRESTDFSERAVHGVR